MKAKKPQLTAENITQIKDALKKQDNDVGSSQVQITDLTARIIHLTGHMSAHRNDKHSRRGLIGLVNARRKLLKYLKRTDAKSHTETLTALGLRK